MNEAVGTVYSVQFEDEDGNPVTLVTIRVPDDTRWSAGQVKITRLDQ